MEFWDYSFRDIKAAYEEVGVGNSRVVMPRTDLRWLGRFQRSSKSDILSAHFKALSELMDFRKNTLVVSTATMSLCNTDAPFDIEKTPSEMGVLTEYVRRKQGALRSFHPFASYTAIGKEAEKICDNVARHAYGPETPKARMIDMNALCVSVGVHPKFTCTTVHHVEFEMGVPYRYVKEFIHPVIRGNVIREEPFYLYVWYKDCELKRDMNKCIFDKFSQDGYKIQEAQLGRGKIYSYSMAEFFQSAVKAFKDDIYIWLSEPPKIRPYRQ